LQSILAHEFFYIVAISADKIKLLSKLVDVKEKEIKKGIQADYCTNFELLNPQKQHTKADLMKVSNSLPRRVTSIGKLHSKNK